MVVRLADSGPAYIGVLRSTCWPGLVYGVDGATAFYAISLLGVTPWALPSSLTGRFPLPVSGTVRWAFIDQALEGEGVCRSLTELRGSVAVSGSAPFLPMSHLKHAGFQPAVAGF